MSKVIEIVVIGGTGSGKSHLLELIDKALRDSYGPHVQIVSRELSQERGLGSPGSAPSADTIFELKECRPAEHSATETLKIEVDKSGISSALESIQGCVQLDHLESAIASTAALIADERDRLNEAGLQSGSLASALMEQMNRLLAIQVEQVGGVRRDAVVDAFVSDIHGIRRRGM